MNQARRKQLAEIAEQLQEMLDRIDQLQAEEQDAFENLSESLQKGEDGQEMEHAVAKMETALDAMEEVLGALEEAQY